MRSSLRAVGMSLAFMGGAAYGGMEIGHALADSRVDSQQVWEASLASTEEWAREYRAEGAIMYIQQSVGRACVEAVDASVLDFGIERKPVDKKALLEDVTRSDHACEDVNPSLVQDLIDQKVKESGSLSRAMTAGREEYEIKKSNDNRRERWKGIGAAIGFLSAAFLNGAMHERRQKRDKAAANENDIMAPFKQQYKN